MVGPQLQRLRKALQHGALDTTKPTSLAAVLLRIQPTIHPTPSSTTRPPAITPASCSASSTSAASPSK